MRTKTLWRLEEEGADENTLEQLECIFSRSSASHDLSALT